MATADSISDVAAEGFGAGAAAYEKGRPSYSDDVVAWLVERLGIAPGRTVVDLAAGTGKLTRLLAATGVTFPVPTGFVVLPLAMVLTAIIALGLDRAFYAPLRKRGAKPVTLLIASIGVTLMIQGVVRLFFGVGTRSFFEHEPKTILRFGTGTAEHLFCRHCGVKSFYQPRSHPDAWSVNAHCLDQPLELTIEQFDGRNWEAAAASLT